MNKKSKKININIYNAPLIFVVAVVPLIMRFHEYDTKLGEYGWFLSDSVQIDLFFYGKMVALIICSIYMIIVLTYKYLYRKQQVKKAYMFFSLLIYAVFVIISTIFSNNIYFSVFGSYEHFESVFVILSYCIIAFYTYEIVDDIRILKSIFPWFLTGIVLMLSIGVLQGIGKDPLNSVIGLKIIGVPDGFNADISDSVPYLTLHNPNFAGIYTAIMAQILITIAICAKKKFTRFFCIFLLSIDIFVLYKSGSKTALIVLFAVFFIYSVFMRQYIKKNLWKYVCIIGVVCACFFLTNVIYGNKLLKDVGYTVKNTTVEDHYLEYIETLDDRVQMSYNGKLIIFAMSVDEDGKYCMKVSDGDGNNYETKYNEETDCYEIADDKGSVSYKIYNNNSFTGFVVNVENINWKFSNCMKENDSSYYSYANGKPLKLHKNEIDYRGYFAEHPQFASLRGFIWSRTFPLLRNHFLIGSGPDTFITEFPNDAIVDKTNVGFKYNYIDRPHNLFLQIFVQTGGISLIAICIFFATYIIDSFKLLIKCDTACEKSFINNIGIGILFSVIIYLLMFITNDSNSGNSPFFFFLLGLGFAVNELIKNDKNKLNGRVQ